jgi:dihydroxyacid dehydratase/phosphogluconate dehydratase
MAHFRGVLSGARSEITRLGHKSSGIRVEAQSWQGKVVVFLSHDDTTGKDVVLVTLQRHNGAGTIATLYDGPVGGMPEATP